MQKRPLNTARARLLPFIPRATSARISTVTPLRTEKTSYALQCMTPSTTSVQKPADGDGWPLCEPRRSRESGDHLVVADVTSASTTSVWAGRLGQRVGRSPDSHDCGNLLHGRRRRLTSPCSN